MKGGGTMDLKDQLKNFSNFKITCMYESTTSYLIRNSDKEYNELENLVLLLEKEIHNRKIGKD